MYLDYVNCRGTEGSIMKCTMRNRISYGDVSMSCRLHSEDASVSCSKCHRVLIEYNYTNYF